MSSAADTLKKLAMAAHALVLERALREPGWIVVHSRVLGIDLLCRRDDTVPIPPEHADLPAFTRVELAWIGTQRPSVDRLRAICDAKREVPGTQIAMEIT